MSDVTIFHNKSQENGLYYYNIPSGYPLYKASKLFNKNDVSLLLENNKPYFFGLKNTSPEYIESYENEYGVIFEFETTRPLKLLALDDKNTQTLLYNNAPPNIKTILNQNYGHINNIRNSVSDKDRELSHYLCSIGEQGYAIYSMQTDFGGTFHTELLICNASNAVKLIKKVTNDIRTVSIIEEEKLKEMGKQLKDKRRKKQKYSSMYDDNTPLKKRNLFGDDDGDNKNVSFSRNLFGDDDMSGGKKRKSRRNKRNRKNKRSRRNKRNK